MEGTRWGTLNGFLAVATLKASHLRLFLISSEPQYFTHLERVTDEGRLRSPRLGPDGNLYITTDGGGGGGEVLKVVPVLPGS